MHDWVRKPNRQRLEIVRSSAEGGQKQQRLSFATPIQIMQPDSVHGCELGGRRLKCGFVVSRLCTDCRCQHQNGDSERPTSERSAYNLHIINLDVSEAQILPVISWLGKHFPYCSEDR
jgi:hypothetical protein